MSDLIKNLQKSPNWSEFEEWYRSNYGYGHIPIDSWYCGGDPKPGFETLPLEFQKGVFEKYADLKGYRISQEFDFDASVELETSDGWIYGIIDDIHRCLRFRTFEELIIWFFNR